VHEMSIAQSILDLAREEARSHGLSRIISIRLKIGEMSGVVPASLLFCWDLLTQDGPAAGSRLEIDAVPLRARCPECGEEFAVEEYVFQCPACGSIRVEISQGRELTLSSIEAE